MKFVLYLKNSMAKEKISKEQAKRPGLYQSAEHPEHFKNEGGEYISDEPNKPGKNSDTKENADFDKMKGNSKE